MADITITYTYDDNDSNTHLSYETVVEAGSKVVLERNPFYVAGKKVLSYSGGGTKYLPAQLITAPNSNLTLACTLTDIRHVQVIQDNDTIDISNTVINIIERKGKNQPFSYVVITVLKELFNDLNLSLVQKETRFYLQVYGITGNWIYERLEDNGSTYDITLVNKAYYLKTTTIQSLFNFRPSTDNSIALTNIGQTVPVTWEQIEEGSNTQYGTFSVGHTGLPSTVTITGTIKRVNTSSTSTPDYLYSIIKIEGTPDNIFKFLVNVIAGFTSFDIKVGTYYALNPSSTYTIADIEGMSQTAISGSEAVFQNVALRLDQYCWDAIETIALLTNRYAIFEGQTARLTTFSSNNVNEYIIGWEEPTLGPNQYYIPVLALSSNEDQGSQYVLSSQKVICEAYETTVAISNTSSTDVGADIVFNSPDNTPLNIGSTDPNEVRNIQARIIALNAIKRYYKPGDCISFSLCLATTPTTTMPDVTDLSSVTEPTGAGSCFKYTKSIPDTEIVLYEQYFTSSRISGVTPATYAWVEYDTDNPTKTTSRAFSTTACLHKLIDEQNNITLNDAPIALIETEYPSCITTYTWGMPEFMDEQSQFKDLTAVAQEAVLDNTSDTQISSSDASKIVVGNQSISELKSDRSGFTGLILEKNVDNQVYRLAGYNMGELQAEFNSLGEIQSGSGNVKIDHEGITLTGGVDIILDQDSSVYANHVALDSNGFTSYQGVTQISQDPDIFIPNPLSAKTVSIRGDGPDNGNIVAGGGAIEIGIIGNNNLVTKNGGTVQCYISNTGELMAGAGAVKLNASGITISDKANITLGSNSKIIANKVILNSDGLKSYGTVSGGSGVGNPLVSIGSDGNISAGQDNIKIGKITVGSKDYALVTYNSSDPVAYITTTGQFVAGNALNGWTVMDNLGLRVYPKGANPITSVSREPILWVDDTGYHLSNTLDGSATNLVDAEVTYGTWNNFVSSGGDIKASVNLLSNVNMNVGPVCMDTDGTIYYSTVLSQEGLNTYSYTYSGTQGAATNVQSTLQCKIDNKGVIVAGGGQVKLDAFGLRTYASNALSGNPVCQVDSSGNIIGITVAADHISAGTLASGVVYAGTINADQINTSTLTANTITLNGGSIVAGGANFNADGVTIKYSGSSYTSASALKFYDTSNAWTPYKLYATYDSGGATSIVKAESKTTGTTIPSKLKMVVDGGGAYGKYTPYTTNSNAYTTYSGYTNFTTTEDYIWLYVGSSNPRTLVTPTNKDSLSIVPGTTVAFESNQNYNLITSKLRKYTDPVGKTTWSGAHTDSVLQSTISINSDEYVELYFDLTDKTSQSISITTPGDAEYHSCEFVAYMANGTTFVFKKYSDDGSSARNTRYVFTTGVSTISQVGIRFANTTSSTEYLAWFQYPINIYRSSGDGASVALDQEGTYIQGNNTINGQLYQSGGPIYFKGAGQNIPAYFDMPIVPLAVMSQGTVSGASVTTRGGATLNSLACRNIVIVAEGASLSGSFNEGDIVLYYTP